MAKAKRTTRASDPLKSTVIQLAIVIIIVAAIVFAYLAGMYVR